jgi:hypothetical protein
MDVPNHKSTKSKDAGNTGSVRSGATGSTGSVPTNSGTHSTLKRSGATGSHSTVSTNSANSGVHSTVATGSVPTGAAHSAADTGSIRAAHSANHQKPSRKSLRNMAKKASKTPFFSNLNDTVTLKKYVLPIIIAMVLATVLGYDSAKILNYSVHKKEVAQGAYGAAAKQLQKIKIDGSGEVEAPVVSIPEDIEITENSATLIKNGTGDVINDGDKLIIQLMSFAKGSNEPIVSTYEYKNPDTSFIVSTEGSTASFYGLFSGRKVGMSFAFVTMQDALEEDSEGASSDGESGATGSDGTSSDGTAGASDAGTDNAGAGVADGTGAVDFVPDNADASADGASAGTGTGAGTSSDAGTSAEGNISQEETGDYIITIGIVIGFNRPEITHAAGEKQNYDTATLPSFKYEASSKDVEISIPKGFTPPSDLLSQTVIKGNGSHITANDSIVVQYNIWDYSGNILTSTWEKHSTDTFEMATIKKYIYDALTEQTVGSRILIVVPSGIINNPDLIGKGVSEEDAKTGQIFSIDILDIED